MGVRRRTREEDKNATKPHLQADRPPEQIQASRGELAQKLAHAQGGLLTVFVVFVSVFIFSSSSSSAAAAVVNERPSFLDGSNSEIDAAVRVLVRHDSRSGRSQEKEC